jgi:hypothetical protein
MKTYILTLLDEGMTTENNYVFSNKKELNKGIKRWQKSEEMEYPPIENEDYFITESTLNNFY